MMLIIKRISRLTLFHASIAVILIFLNYLEKLVTENLKDNEDFS
jgi:hypothetical protein